MQFLPNCGYPRPLRTRRGRGTFSGALPAAHAQQPAPTTTAPELLKAWVEQHSIGTLHSNLSIKARPAGGLGMFTEAPVQRGQVLVRVPHRLMMTAESACQDREYGPLLAGGAATEWQVGHVGQASALHILPPPPPAGTTAAAAAAAGAAAAAELGRPEGARGGGCPVALLPPSPAVPCRPLLLPSPAAPCCQALVLHLLCERARGSASFWAPYLALLPDQADHPLAWGASRLSWLAGSPLQATLVARQQQVAEDCEALSLLGANQLPLAAAWRATQPPPLLPPSLPPLPPPCPPCCPQARPGSGGEDLVSVGSVTWAASSLLSRAFSLDMAPDEALEGDMSSFGSWQPPAPDVLALVPWADSLSHASQAGPESCLRYCCDLQAASLSAHTAYQAGEEVFDSYGPGLSPSDLLLDFGFVDPGNRNHRVDVDVTQIVAPKSGRARSLLAALGAVQGGACRLVLGEAGPDLPSLAYLRAALASDADLVRAGWRLRATEADTELACRVMGSLGQPSSRTTEQAVLQALAGWLAQAAAAYPSTLEEDLAELERPETAWLRRQVLLALSSEKKALRGSAAAVGEWLEQLDAGVSLDLLYPDAYEDGLEEEDGDEQGSVAG
ncbi:hypothetical protein QJQ45_030112 [Haematococcus lacustris]|nr:hypothetical protein QJQ45_030112 [Haematococcus lacustris]